METSFAVLPNVGELDAGGEPVDETPSAAPP
jgi:hypothetical protein